MTIILYVVLGLLAGILSGLLGIAGGIVIIPSLVFFFGFSQQQAQGTTLALMVPPIGILAAWTYYQKGYVDLKAAALICVGVFVGALLGARVATALPTSLLQKIFGVLMLVVGVKMIFNR